MEKNKKLNKAILSRERERGSVNSSSGESFFLKEIFKGSLFMIGMLLILGVVFVVYSFVQPTVSPSQSHYYMPQNMQKIFASILGSPQFHNCSDLYDVGIRKNGVYKLTNGTVTYYTFCNFSNSTNGYNHPLNNCLNYYNLEFKQNGFYYIQPNTSKLPFKGFCDMIDNDGGWIEIYGDGYNFINPINGTNFASENGVIYNYHGNLSIFYVDSYDNSASMIYSGHYINTTQINFYYSQVMIKYNWDNYNHSAYSDGSGLYLGDTRIISGDIVNNLNNLKIECKSSEHSIEEGGATNVHIYVR